MGYYCTHALWWYRVGTGADVGVSVGGAVGGGIGAPTLMMVAVTVVVPPWYRGVLPTGTAPFQYCGDASYTATCKLMLILPVPANARSPATATRPLVGSKVKRVVGVRMRNVGASRLSASRAATMVQVVSIGAVSSSTQVKVGAVTNGALSFWLATSTVNCIEVDLAGTPSSVTTTVRSCDVAVS